jgi:hypothetical protein
MLCCAPVLAQAPLLSEVNTVAAATQGVPVEYTFNVAQTGTYTVTLTDLGAQQTPAAPLASVALAISTGSTIVGTPLTAAGTMQFTATSTGSYVLRVVGQPGPVVGSGPFGVVIANVASNTQIVNFSGALTVPPAGAPDVAVLNDTFTVATSGNYTVTLTDLRFPQSLQTLQLALLPQGGNALLASLSAAGTQQVSPPVALTASTTYDVIAFGQSGAAVNAGLYAVVVRDSGSNVVYSSTLAVGTLTALTPTTGVAIAAGGYTLSFADLAFPVALANLTQGVIVTLDDQVAASLTAAGTTTFAATGGQYQVFALATPASSPGAGSYDVDVRLTAGGAPPVLSVAQAVSAAGSATQGYTFNTNVTTAGSYTLQLGDYQIPAALSSATLIAVQAGASVGTLTSPGNSNLSLAAGNVSVLVFAKSAAAGGLFGLFLSPQAGGSPIFETVQGTGNTVFTSTRVTVTTAGNYLATLTDLAFPAAFGTLYLVVTQGTSVTGWLAGGGELPFVAAPGDYFVTFAAQPSAAAQAGTYALTVEVSNAPPPTVMLSAGASSVTSGNATTLTWSTQNAISCTASGGWSGTEPLSGTTNTPALTSDTTFTLSCTGAGGTTAQSVTVSVTAPPPPPPSGHGGGGALDPGTLSLLLGLLLLRARAGRVSPPFRGMESC